jgi:hypothetical protein
VTSLVAGARASGGVLLHICCGQSTSPFVSLMIKLSCPPALYCAVKSMFPHTPATMLWNVSTGCWCNPASPPLFAYHRHRPVAGTAQGGVPCAHAGLASTAHAPEAARCSPSVAGNAAHSTPLCLAAPLQVPEKGGKAAKECSPLPAATCAKLATPPPAVPPAAAARHPCTAAAPRPWCSLPRWGTHGTVIWRHAVL